MAEPKKYTLSNGDVRWSIRYRKPNGQQTTQRGFKTKKEANDWHARNTLSINRASYIDPMLGRTPLRDLAPTWMLIKESSVKGSYYSKLEEAWRLHVEPQWGDVPVSAITKVDVQAWIGALHVKGCSVTLITRVYGVLAGMLDLAVDKKLLNPHDVRKVTLPRKQKTSNTYLTWQQVQQFVDAAKRAPDKILIQFLAATGLRWGEAVALRGSDLRRGRVYVERTMTTDKDGKITVGPVKTWERRWVALPQHVKTILPLVLPNALVFPGPRGEMRGYVNTTSWFTLTVARLHETTEGAFPTVTPHDLRHTAASLAIQAGANVKTLQRMLGHKSAVTTLDTYADVWDDDLEALATQIDDARTTALSRTNDHTDHTNHNGM